MGGGGSATSPGLWSQSESSSNQEGGTGPILLIVSWADDTKNAHGNRNGDGPEMWRLAGCRGNPTIPSRIGLNPKASTLQWARTCSGPARSQSIPRKSLEPGEGTVIRRTAQRVLQPPHLHRAPPHKVNHSYMSQTHTHTLSRDFHSIYTCDPASKRQAREAWMDPSGALEGRPMLMPNLGNSSLDPQLEGGITPWKKSTLIPQLV